MEIPFRSQFDSMHSAFIMTFEIQNIAPVYNVDVPRLDMQVNLKRELHNDQQIEDLYPVILDLYGRLYRANANQDTGATLLPTFNLPITLFPGVSNPANLSFAFSAYYLQLLEEQRALQQGQDMLLAMQMWGVAAMVRPRTDTPGVYAHLQSRSSEVIRFEKVDTGPTAQFIRIERSTWVDRILPSLGYRRSVIIELPLIRVPAIPEAYQKAAEAIDMARRAFEQEDYRAATRHARDVLEYLAKSSQGGQITTFCDEYIKPVVGETKSKAIDRSFNAIRDIVNAGSHIDPQRPFMVERAIAAYVIETLALNLRYISSTLG